MIDAWTGLRWSELRAIRVRDLVEVPMPILIVQIAEPEGVKVKVKVTKSRKSRRVFVARAWGRSGDGSGTDGARVDSDHETLPAPTRGRLLTRPDWLV